MTSVFDLPEPSATRSVTEQAQTAEAVHRGGSLARREAGRAQREHDRTVRDNTTAWDLIGAAQVDGGIGFIHRSYLNNEVLDRADPEYRLPDDFQKRMEAAGIGPDQWELFAKATSEEHFELLMRFARENQDVNETRAQFGLVANMASGFTDPVAFALDASTAGLSYSARAARMVNMARSGAAAAATGGALTAASGAFNPEVGVEDVALSAGASFVLGAGLGARQGSEWVDARVVENIVKRDITGQAGSAQSLGAARVEGLLEEPTPGLARRDPSSAVQEHVDRGVDEAGIRPAFEKVRVSLAARMGSSKSPTARALSRRLFRDGVGYNDRDAVIQESAGEAAMRNRSTLEAALQRGYNAAWVDERKAKGISMWDRGAELEWSRQVSDALRGIDVESPAARAAAQRLRKVLDDAHELGVRSGVLDPDSRRENYFPQLQSRAAYQRIFGELGISEDQAVDLYKQSILKQMRDTADPDALKKFEEIEANYKGASDAALRARERADNIQQDIGERKGVLREAEMELDEAVAAGVTGRSLRALQRRVADQQRKLQRSTDRLKRAQERLHDATAHEDKIKFSRNQAKAVADDAGVDEELAAAYARAIVNRGKNQLHGDEANLVKPLSTDDLDALKATLEEAGATAERIESILGKYRARIAEGSKLGQAKRRIDLDPSFRAKVVNRYGDEVEIGITDFMENDAQRVVMAHVRDISGWSALASRANMRSWAEVNAVKDQIRREAIQAGENPDRALRAIDIGVNSALGRSTETNPNGGVSRASRALRDHQFIRVMNQVGFTLFTELGPTIAYSGLRNVIRSVPYLTDFMKRGRDGTLKSSEARYIEDLIATGTEHLRNPPLLRIEDDAFAPPVFGDNAFGRGYENLTQRASRLTSVMSGMAPMNAMLQRLAGRASLLRILELANQKRPLSANMERRLRNWGLDDETRDAVFAHLKGKKKIDDIAEADMPLEVRERMAAFLYRLTRHQVIEGDASDSVRLMHNAGGKLLMQFRSFMAYSYERHLLNGLHMRDWQAAQMLVLSTSIAGLQWSARTYLNYAGDEEKRRELLTKGNFMKNAVAQSSWGGVVPAITDTVLPLMGQDPLFQGNRSTGLSNNMLTGAPSVDFAMKAYEAATLPGQALNPNKDVTRRELEQAAKALWFQNMTGWQNVQRAMFDAAEDSGWISNDAPNEKRARADDKKNGGGWSSSYLFDLSESE